MKYDSIFMDNELKRMRMDALYVEQGDMPKVRNERKPVAFKVDGVDTRDAPDFSDAFISYAEWSDSGEALTEEELEELNSDSSVVYEAVMSTLS
jgi:hypothetical protein